MNWGCSYAGERQARGDRGRASSARKPRPDGERRLAQLLLERVEQARVEVRYRRVPARARLVLLKPLGHALDVREARLLPRAARGAAACPGPALDAQGEPLGRVLPDAVLPGPVAAVRDGPEEGRQARDAGGVLVGEIVQGDVAQLVPDALAQALEAEPGPAIADLLRAQHGDHAAGTHVVDQAPLEQRARRQGVGPRDPQARVLLEDRRVPRGTDLGLKGGADLREVRAA